MSYIAQYDDPRALEYVSPQADALLGFTGREIAFWQTRLVDDDRAVFDAAASAVRKTREPVSVEYRLLDRDEQVVWVRDTAVVAVGAEGDLTVQGFLTDVTHEKQLELELAREREQTDAFFRDSSVGMVITDAEGRFVRVNEALAAINGISVEDHVGKRLRELLPVVADHVEPLLEEVWRTGKPVMGREIGVEIAPGRALHSLVSYFPVNTAGAKQFGGIVVDTSDFHRSVDARATTEREHRRLIEKLPLVVYVNTLSGTGLGEGRRTSYISPQVEQLFGYPPSAWFADDILWEQAGPSRRFALLSGTRRFEPTVDRSSASTGSCVRTEPSVGSSTRCTRSATTPARPSSSTHRTLPCRLYSHSICPPSAAISARASGPGPRVVGEPRRRRAEGRCSTEADVARTPPCPTALGGC